MYNVYYFMVKPLKCGAIRTKSGGSKIVSPTAKQFNAARKSVLKKFETLFALYMKNSVKYIPCRSARNQRVKIIQIPEKASGEPNFTGLNIKPNEPIVYLSTKNNHAKSPKTNRRPPIVLIDAIVAGRYKDNDTGGPQLFSAVRNSVSNTSAEGGLALHFSVNIPVVAEVASEISVSYGATNWQDLQADMLAMVAFHEIAHCKCECVNREKSRSWKPAISGTIHSVKGVGICSANLSGSTKQTNADKKLMGEHILCPIRFYKLDQPIAVQFYQKNKSVTLKPKPAQPTKPSQPTQPSRDSLFGGL